MGNFYIYILITINTIVYGCLIYIIHYYINKTKKAIKNPVENMDVFGLTKILDELIRINTISYLERLEIQLPIVISDTQYKTIMLELSKEILESMSNQVIIELKYYFSDIGLASYINSRIDDPIKKFIMNINANN